MTPKDRLGNRYMINFVDFKSNYCRVFLARTKDAAAKLFEHFLVYFEKDSTARSTFCAPTPEESTRTWTCSASARAWPGSAARRETSPAMARPSACTAPS
ncbi:hypothetical protein PF005_g33372 [Phytophthora fragariae]|nr:hypothetical protein PF005_g33372 [Phytophthora fragariae]